MDYDNWQDPLNANGKMDNVRGQVYITGFTHKLQIFRFT